jgi:hypothetical protein
MTNLNRKRIIRIALLVGITCAVVLACRAEARGDELVIDGAVGVFNSGKSSLSETKFVKFAIEEPVWYALKQRFNAGMWLDNKGLGRMSSGFAGYQLGFQVTADTLEASVWSGPTLITTPDVYLGGPLQFNETLFLGVHDKMGQTIGVAYNHFSSAGIEMPNIGRDFFGLEVRFKF